MATTYIYCSWKVVFDILSCIGVFLLDKKLLYFVDSLFVFCATVCLDQRVDKHEFCKSVFFGIFTRLYTRGSRAVQHIGLTSLTRSEETPFRKEVRLDSSRELER